VDPDLRIQINTDPDLRWQVITTSSRTLQWKDGRIEQDKKSTRIKINTSSIEEEEHK